MRQAEAETRELRAHLARLESRLGFLERLDNVVTQPSAWMGPSARKGALHHATATLLMSDLHLDEKVRPVEVEWANAYNRRIARQRLRRLLDRAVRLSRDYYAGLHYDGCVVMFGGDIFTGEIHEELMQTNEDTILGSLDYWSEELAGFLLGLADHFGQVHCYGVVGNHGRRTRKPRAKLKVRDNFDWFLYRMLARATQGKVAWTIPESGAVDIPVYGTRYRLTHGDSGFRGGNGIAGMLSPLMRGKARTHEQQSALGKAFDHLVVGHWHRYFMGDGLIVNGSLKGYDEYAFAEQFRPEPAIQAMWLTTPEHGAAFGSRIFCEDRKTERWEDVG